LRNWVRQLQWWYSWGGAILTQAQKR